MKSSIVNLQVLRCLACVIVIFAHVELSQYASQGIEVGFFGGGAIGVDIFFVISGFIMMLVSSGPARFNSSCKDGISFLSRRIFRVLPLNTGFILLTILICVCFSSFPFLQNNFSVYHFPSSKVDMYWFLESVSFLHFNKSSIYGVAWTLQYEFIFYVLVAITVFFKLPKLPFFLAYGVLVIVSKIPIAQGTWHTPYLM